MSNVSKASSSVKKKTIYRVKNWAAYNRSLIARGSLTLWLDEAILSSGITPVRCNAVPSIPIQIRPLKWP